jgi:hypothetical protein
MGQQNSKANTNWLVFSMETKLVARIFQKPNGDRTVSAYTETGGRVCFYRSTPEGLKPIAEDIPLTYCTLAAATYPVRPISELGVSEYIPDVFFKTLGTSMFHVDVDKDQLYELICKGLGLDGMPSETDEAFHPMRNVDHKAIAKATVSIAKELAEVHSGTTIISAWHKINPNPNKKKLSESKTFDSLSDPFTRLAEKQSGSLVQEETWTIRALTVASAGQQLADDTFDYTWHNTTKSMSSNPEIVRCRNYFETNVPPGEIASANSKRSKVYALEDVLAIQRELEDWQSSTGFASLRNATWEEATFHDYTLW